MNITKKIFFSSLGLAIIGFTLYAAEEKYKGAVPRTEQAEPLTVLDGKLYFVYQTSGAEATYNTAGFSTLAQEKQAFIYQQWVQEAIAKKDIQSIARALAAAKASHCISRQLKSDALNTIHQIIADTLRSLGRALEGEEFHTFVKSLELA